MTCFIWESNRINSGNLSPHGRGFAKKDLDMRQLSRRVFPNEVSNSFTGTQDSISSYYLLDYYTRNQNPDGGFRKIQVTRKGDTQAKVEYRPGYYAFAAGELPTGAGSAGVGNGAGLDPTIPLLLHKREPEYSEEARKAKYQGTVRLDVEVDGSGQVTNMRVIRALGLNLNEKAMEAVKQWKFRPGMRNGQPIAVQAQVDVSFRLL
jgi:TonB family protein